MVLAILFLAILTASMQGLAASYAKESELLYRRGQALDRELGEAHFDVRQLKSPSEVELRTAALKSGQKPVAAKAAATTGKIAAADRKSKTPKTSLKKN